MRTQKYKNLTSGLGILAVFVMVLAMIPVQVIAADSDGDGFPDDLETTTGVVLPPGIDPADPDAVTFPPCTSGADLSTCMDVNRIDLFFILRKATPSNITATPLELMDLVTQSFANSGLDISVHSIDETLAGPDREVYCDAPVADGSCSTDVGQKAVRITELTSPSVILGYCPQGTPMDGDDCTIYTGEIVDFVTSTCGGKTCQAYVGEAIDSNRLTTEEEIINQYIELVTIHETGHTLDLAIEYNRRFGGNHLKTGTGFILDQTIVYTDKKGTVTFYFPGGYSTQSQNGPLLN